MKKYILGYALLFIGVIGLSLWLIAETTNKNGYTEIPAGLHNYSWVIVLLFIAMTVAGLILLLILIRKSGSKS